MTSETASTINTEGSMQLEGRLNAYRRLLIGLATELARRDDGRAAIEAMLADAEIVDTQEEDPGVLPDQAFAGQEIATEEIRTVLTAALARRDALDAQAHAIGAAAQTGFALPTGAASEREAAE
ncbi:hypothetical protein BTR14_04020 [Rhizobium rhizosphaerae]|uniref:Uncharacterized protein n=1 Tax=Xaviernesmea rhizosphaerae TaxID=1672749 RepID=A0ABX3PI66_9HYPH|nr:hypothetical protein [Xaviernesmea rhizosphaerae]OQP87737.1 hypothetical protein BTR14_04020 [Xaviernesmea rhizosphaerae]